MSKLVEYLKAFINTKSPYEQYIESANTLKEYEHRQVEYAKLKALYFVGA